MNAIGSITHGPTYSSSRGKVGTFNVISSRMGHPIPAESVLRWRLPRLPLRLPAALRIIPSKLVGRRHARSVGQRHAQFLAKLDFFRPLSHLHAPIGSPFCP